MPKIIFTDLMFTPSGPAYKFMAEKWAAQGVSDSDFYYDSHNFTVNRQMPLYCWFGPTTTFIYYNYEKIKDAPLLFSEILIIICVLNQSSC